MGIEANEDKNRKDGNMKYMTEIGVSTVRAGRSQ